MARLLRLLPRRTPLGKRRPGDGRPLRPLRAAGPGRPAQTDTETEEVRAARFLTGLAWAAAITSIEAAARARTGSRARGWLTAYALIGWAAGAARPRLVRRPLHGSLWLGLPLALAGYQSGRALLRDRPLGPPPEPAWLEALALACAVAPAEELAWGGQVESRLGLPVTSILFALKHAVIDGRIRRVLGLALFWTGLGLLRSRSPRLALALHIGANAGGVVLGHATGQDAF